VAQTDPLQIDQLTLQFYLGVSHVEKSPLELVTKLVGFVDSMDAMVAGNTMQMMSKRGCR
jgi:hypothetical protein